MTEVTTPIEQPAPAGNELSGVDLAQVALHAAREGAKKRGVRGPRTPRRRERAVRRDGRDPQGFAAVLQGLITDRAWELPAAGGTVLDRCTTIAAAVAPQLPTTFRPSPFTQRPASSTCVPTPLPTPPSFG
ncbi:hypothetical protein AB0K09_28045 [Streptomyces sp. NPDC049577]|uniref:hypothetical protein n=1 Tax=Streptomyces sp. NPDC049577 TaxID=3155153 RepID=UPI00341373D4